MRDWRNCKKLLATRKKEVMEVEGKSHIFTFYDFNICKKCPVKKCKGKVLINAEQKAMNALNTL